MNTIDFASLDATTARSAAAGKVGRVPSGRAGNVVARSGDRVRSAIHRAHVRTNSLAVLLPDALDNGFLDSCTGEINHQDEFTKADNS